MRHNQITFSWKQQKGQRDYKAELTKIENVFGINRSRFITDAIDKRLNEIESKTYASIL